MGGSVVDETRPFLNLVVLAQPKASPFQVHEHLVQIASVIRIMLKQLEHVAALPTIWLGMRPILPTAVR